MSYTSSPVRRLINFVYSFTRALIYSLHRRSYIFVKIDYLLLQQKRIRLVRSLAIVEPLLYHPPLHSIIYFILCLFNIFILLSYVFSFYFFVLFSAVCNPVCRNGGLCVSPNQCRCVPGYTGPQCLESRCLTTLTSLHSLFIVCVMDISWLAGWSIKKVFTLRLYSSVGGGGWGGREGKETGVTGENCRHPALKTVSQGEIWT